MKGWFEKLALEDPTLYGEQAPGVHIHMASYLLFNYRDPHKKNAAKRDSAGAVCNSGMGMLFF